MSRIPESCSPVNARAQLGLALQEAEAVLRQTIGLRLTELLIAIVRYVLDRPYHQRREKVSQHVRREGRCCRCGTTKSYRFYRNGFRRRHLLTGWGEVEVDLPRVRCECGGSVVIDFGGVLQPYQRIWDDVDAQIERWGALALSLRQMLRELSHLRIGPLALRTLNQRLHQLGTQLATPSPSQVPPILQVDAFWVTAVLPNGRVDQDRKGRRRLAVGRFRRPLFVAMGVWPDRDYSQILAWHLAASESTEEWVRFLETLEARGIRGENGLKLIIHDGGAGLGAALEMVWFDAYQQRCLFHKLRNISRAIRLPDDLSELERRRYRRRILRDFRSIWEARHYETMLRRYLQVVRTYRHCQPEAVATLRRDFRSTVTYYRLEQEFPHWERRHLRTTSRLERFHRQLRRRVRAANAYHSEAGVMAMIAQEVHQFHANQHAP